MIGNKGTMKNFVYRTHNNIFTILFVSLLLSSVLVGCSLKPQSPFLASAPNRSRTITVTGSGIAKVKPDICYLFIQIHIERPGNEAVYDNNTATRKLVDSLKQIGIAEEDIKVSDFSLFQTVQHDTSGIPFTVSTTVNTSVYVSVRDIDSIGKVLDVITSSQIYLISSIQFDLVDRQQAAREARDNAIANAREQAEASAAAQGLVLGDIKSISYLSTDQFQFQVAKSERAINAPGISIRPGEMHIPANILVTYEVK